MTQLLQHCSGFEQLFFEAVDESLSWLGNSVKEAVYLDLEETFKIEKQDIPHRLDELIMVLETIFGQGAKLIQIQIMKRLFQKTRCSFEYNPARDNVI